MIMTATVLSIQRGSMLVFDFSNRQQVQVNTNNTFRFCPGDLVRIRYNGAMTMSIPPQISATSIVRISSSRCGSTRLTHFPTHIILMENRTKTPEINRFREFFGAAIQI